MTAAVQLDTLVVFGLIAGAVILFVTERLTPDTTAIAVIVSLVVLEPFTHVPARDAISGFSNPATLTIVAMYILSGGIESTGAIQRLGVVLGEVIGHDSDRLLGITVGITGPLAGIINNTPVVAIFIPMVMNLADRVHLSPSKILIPLSYASMLGGTLTLIGTTTNLVASDLSAQLIGRRFTMFEFTHLGVVVLIVGSLYLLTVGQWLLPERIQPVDLITEFSMTPYLWRLRVRGDSPLADRSVAEAFAETHPDLDVLQIVRGERSFVAPGTDRDILAQDRLTVRADEATVRAFAEEHDLQLLPRAAVTDAELDRPEGQGILIEAVVPPGSALIGQTIADAALRERFRATVLAVRHGNDIVHDELRNVGLAEGDGLLLHAAQSTLDRLSGQSELLVTETSGTPTPDTDTASNGAVLLALAIMAGVIVVAALGLLPIVIAALAGVVAMLVTGIIRPREAYDTVNWDVIFLLAGVIPLGLALQRTGGAEVIGGLIVQGATVLPVIAVVALVYLLTATLANVITPVASIVLMLPIAVETATRIGANEFAFVLAATFAATSAFMTPIGYQTNLMVYSPGGYRFTDYVRIGAPLQLLHAVTVTIGIAAFWGIT